MTRLIFVAFILFACSTSAQKLNDLIWLTGKWERTNVRPGRTAFEQWEMNGQKSLTGTGVTLQGTDTVFVEGLSIVEKDGDLYYVANVSSNAEATFFKVTSYNKTGFVSENPAHDFPKKIEYKLEGDILTATISGNGKEIPFSFKRVIE